MSAGYLTPDRASLRQRGISDTASMLIELAGPKKTCRVCQTEERWKEAVNLIVSLTGRLFALH